MCFGMWIHVGDSQGVKEELVELLPLKESSYGAAAREVLRVALICGGPSEERGISLNSARSVLVRLEENVFWAMCKWGMCKWGMCKWEYV